MKKYKGEEKLIHKMNEIRRTGQKVKKSVINLFISLYTDYREGKRNEKRK